jgi:hypothetical protein
MNFKCKICKKICHENYSGTHLKKKHNISGKEYYDKYIKINNECRICKHPTSFLTVKRGYRKCCSKLCANKYKNKSLKEEFGVINYFQLESVKEKTAQTNLKKYGVKNPSQSEKIKQKKKQTLLKNYGVEFGLQSPKIKLLQELTMLDRYGSRQAMHIKKFVDKCISNGGGRCSARKYTTSFNDEITIQGSYEEKFVSLCESENIRIINGPCVPYLFNGKAHKYFVDFQIFQDNQWRLIEIKSSYYYEKYKERVSAKSSAAKNWSTKNNYLDYSLIIDNIKIP